MNMENKCPFESAKIEIFTLGNIDVVTASPYPGEEDLFPTSWRDINEE